MVLIKSVHCWKSILQKGTNVLKNTFLESIFFTPPISTQLIRNIQNHHQTNVLYGNNEENVQQLGPYNLFVITDKITDIEVKEAIIESLQNETVEYFIRIASVAH